MRILVIVLKGLASDQLLADERLANLHQLMSSGCYGSLPLAGGASFEQDVVCEQLAQAGKQVLLAGRERQALAQQAHRPRLLLVEGGWDFLRVTVALAPEDTGLGERVGDYGLALDGEIGQMLELLEGDTAVLLLTEPATGAGKAVDVGQAYGAFVLAVPGYPPLGELRGVAWSDLAPTVLDLAGCDMPAWLQGQSLLAGWQPASNGEDLSVDEEALLRARLAGLGYIG